MPTPFASHRGPAPHVLSLVLAGGEGRRLWPLTADRAKPAVPMCGRYRLIDFVLSNLVNSGLLQIKVLTQYKSDSLNTHIARGWRLPAFLDLYVEVVPAQQRTGASWFKGSADAIYQSLNVITDEEPDYVAVFGGDHMYKMDVRQMIEAHIFTDADATVAVIPVPVEEARAFGILEIDDRGKVVAFDEKPMHPKEMPGRPGWALASMGNYVFTQKLLLEELARDASGDSAHDFGRNILPEMVARGRDVFAYDFSTNEVPGIASERARLLARRRDHQRLLEGEHGSRQGRARLRPVQPALAAAHLDAPVAAGEVRVRRSGRRLGPRAHGHRHRLARLRRLHRLGRAHRSHGLSPQVRVNSFAYVEESIIMDGVDIGRHCRIRRAIIDKGVHVPPNTEIGYDPEADARRFTVSDGIVVVPKGYQFVQ